MVKRQVIYPSEGVAFLTLIYDLTKYWKIYFLFSRDLSSENPKSNRQIRKPGLQYWSDVPQLSRINVLVQTQIDGFRELERKFQGNMPFKFSFKFVKSINLCLGWSIYKGFCDYVGVIQCIFFIIITNFIILFYGTRIIFFSLASCQTILYASLLLKEAIFAILLVTLS